jgi:purine-binding chemotaxis protein CheW
MDWEELKARLRRATSAQAQPTSSGQAEDLYQERARELALRREQRERAAETLPVLAFTLGSERYGIALTALAGVLPFANCTPVPRGPAELLGVIHYRGQVCSVLDLAGLLGLPPTSPAGYVLLLRRQREIGLKVDRVETILSVPPETLRIPAGEEAGGAGSAFLGLTADRLRLVSPDILLSHPLLTEAPRE